ncbi:MAG TPA: hypothetical protein VNL18_15450 [Gemmatimonadales bacterium]|nr:hypothetical protein [Gemmatimonadales bacterium]
MGIIASRGWKVWEGDYDFAVDGGSVGTITLRSKDGPIDNGSIIMGGVLDIETACLSGTGTMALQAEAAGDLLAATGQAGLTVGRKSVIPVFTGASSVKTTAARNPAVVIATAAFTAGKFRLTLFYK